MSNVPDMTTEQGVAATSQKLDYRNLMLRHLDRISQVGGFIPKLGAVADSENFAGMSPTDYVNAQKSIQINSLRTSVALLESFVSPYRDKKYRDGLEVLLRDFGAKKDVTVKDKEEFVLAKCSLLIDLLGREGLLLQREVSLDL